MEMYFYKHLGNHGKLITLVLIGVKNALTCLLISNCKQITIICNQEMKLEYLLAFEYLCKDYFRRMDLSLKFQPSLELLEFDDMESEF